ncbi:MAG: hypothetical protein ACI9JM_001211 [Halioglobus sp.]
MVEIVQRISNSRALKRAALLHNNGEINSALECLVEANRKRPHEVIEQAIVDLLLQMKQTEELSNAPAQSLPASEECLRDFVSGEIPEVQASELSAALLKKAISKSGYLIVRGFFNTEDAEDIKHCIDRSLNARADADEAQDEHARNAWYYASEHFPGSHVAYSKRNQTKAFSRTGSIRVIDSPRGTFKVLEVYRQRGIKKLMEEYFGQAALLSIRKWVFRLIEPIEGMDDSIGGGWHQDGQFMGEGVIALNMWVSLTDCGHGTPAPGITLLPKRIEEIVEFGTHGAHLKWVVGGELVEELAADAPIISPTFAPGDALFFDHYSLHRSGHGPDQSTNRYALESWFYAKSATAGNSAIPYF